MVQMAVVLFLYPTLLAPRKWPSLWIVCVSFPKTKLNHCKNSISIKVWALFKNAIKTKNCNMLNHLNFYLTDKSTEKTFSMFLLTNLTVFCKYIKQQNVTPVTHSKKK